MKGNRLRHRLFEMVATPLIWLLWDGSLHLLVGMPFITEFLVGGMTAAFLIRGIDALRTL